MIGRRRTLGVLLASTWLVHGSGCGDRQPSAPAEREPASPRRVIEPPSGTVWALPPHAIRSDGVGPYLLGKPIAALLEQLPSGPRIARFEIPGLLHESLIRAEDGTVLIGGEPSSSTNTTTFIAVIGNQVASTESGVHVGSSREELLRALGPLVEQPDRAFDPRVAVPSGLRNSRILLDNGRVAAIVVIAEPKPAREPTADLAACPRPPTTTHAFGICLTGSGELVEVDHDEITIRTPEPERTDGPDDSHRKAEARTLGTLRVANVVFAAPLRNTAEGRDELVVVARTDEPEQRTWSLSVYRSEAGRMIRVVDPSPLYALTSAQTRWIGADLQYVDLYLELAHRPDGIEVGGLLTTRNDNKIRDVVLISPVQVARKRGKSPPSDLGDAGVSGSLPAPPDSGAGPAKL